MDQERVRRLGRGVNAQYVLASSLIKMGVLNRFTADILNIEDGSFIDGYAERNSVDSVACTEGTAGDRRILYGRRRRTVWVCTT